jgi:hypothetical protein
MKTTIAVGGLAALVLGCLLAATPGNAFDQDASVVASPFKGQIIAVGDKADPESGVLLENAKVRRLGDRHFLVGIGADYGHPDDWMKGKLVWFPIDDVDTITEFSNIDEYKNAPNGPDRPGSRESRD